VGNELAKLEDCNNGSTQKWDIYRKNDTQRLICYEGTRFCLHVTSEPNVHFGDCTGRTLRVILFSPNDNKFIWNAEDNHRLSNEGNDRVCLDAYNNQEVGLWCCKSNHFQNQIWLWN
jgi:hypothetical protein